MNKAHYIKNIHVLLLSYIFIINQTVYSDNLIRGDNSNVLYLVIGVVQEVKTISLDPIPKWELLSGDIKHGGSGKIYAQLDIRRIIIKQGEVYKISNGITSNIPLNRIVLLGPRRSYATGKSIFYANEYLPQERYKQSLDANFINHIVLEVVPDKCYQIEEGSAEYNKTLKRYDVKMIGDASQQTTNKPASEIPQIPGTGKTNDLGTAGTL